MTRSLNLHLSQDGPVEDVASELRVGQVRLSWTGHRVPYRRLDRARSCAVAVIVVVVVVVVVVGSSSSTSNEAGEVSFH